MFFSRTTTNGLFSFPTVNGFPDVELFLFLFFFSGGVFIGQIFPYDGETLSPNILLAFWDFVCSPETIRFLFPLDFSHWLSCFPIT
jgi:hypothetical protein